MIEGVFRVRGGVGVAFLCGRGGRAMAVHEKEGMVVGEVGGGLGESVVSDMYG